MSWNYQRDESTGFKPVPVGDHRIRIKNAEKKQSSTGKDMLALEFEVSGCNSKLFHNIVFLPDRPEITNRNLTQFFDSFKDIPDGDLNTANWIGKVGAAKVKHEEYNGNTQARIQWFIHKDKQGDLPAWKEPENGSNTMLGAGGGGNAGASASPNVNVPDGIDEECPF